MAASGGRVLVHVCEDAAAPLRVHFLQSVTSMLRGSAPDHAHVHCSLQAERLVLSRAPEAGGVLLKRAPFCPIKLLPAGAAAAIPSAVLQRGVDVGVALLLQSADGRVLLTRRAGHLHVFPNVWVPPGGHVEPGETLVDAVLREMQEETGLRLEPQDVRPRILGLWESVYPPFLSVAPPLRHHVVVYFLAASSLSHLELQAALSPSPAEVSGCVWVGGALGRAVVSCVDGEHGDVRADGLPSSLSAWEVAAGGAVSRSRLPTSVLLRRAATGGPDVERVSTGTKFALDLWLQSLEP